MENNFTEVEIEKVEYSYSYDRNFLVPNMERLKPWATKEIIINYTLIRDDSS